MENVILNNGKVRKRLSEAEPSDYPAYIKEMFSLMLFS